MTQETTEKALSFASWAVIATGAMLAVASHSALGAPTALYTDIAFWPIDGAPSLNNPLVRLLLGVLGAVLIGWGALILQIVRAQGPIAGAGARRMIAVSVGLWFTVDGAASLLVGAYGNAAANCIFAALFLTPVWLARRSAQPDGATGGV
ncbi:MAG: hypothetical protein QNJ84_14290 [Alphaproteobacteria bacterium]|nr:hypothetical protein [Alphaproteobacteria bacterium]